MHSIQGEVYLLNALPQHLREINTGEEETKGDGERCAVALKLQWRE